VALRVAGDGTASHQPGVAVRVTQAACLRVNADFRGTGLPLIRDVDATAVVSGTTLAASSNLAVATLAGHKVTAPGPGAFRSAGAASDNAALPRR
jgi:hypothetical protein